MDGRVCLSVKSLPGIVELTTLLADPAMSSSQLLSDVRQSRKAVCPPLLLLPSLTPLGGKMKQGPFLFRATDLEQEEDIG